MKCKKLKTEANFKEMDGITPGSAIIARASYGDSDEGRR